MMAFRVGQKVVCVNEAPDPDSFFLETDVLRNGAVYTVASIGPTHWGNPGVALIEVPRPMGMSFRASRFRPAVERKTDISIFTEILNGQRVPERQCS
jgi:hypothetical protein